MAEKRENIGAAIDVGTTTIVCECVDLGTGENVASAAVANPQARFGADVMSRIAASQEHLAELTACLRSAVNELCETTCGVSPQRVVIAANTVMLHFLCGVSPLSLGTYPYASVLPNKSEFGGDEIGINANSVFLLPPISSFVGGDVTAGVVSLGMQRKDSALMLDLGTNGEAVSVSGGRMTAASAAAGPAFEGGGVECGMRYAPGAIYRVEQVGARLVPRVVGGERPRGICGSGLVGAFAALRRIGALDDNGAFVGEAAQVRLRDGRFYLTENVYVSQADVRAFQLAKSAVRCALEAVGDDVRDVYICGSFGDGIDAADLEYLGVLPSLADKNVVVCGNTSLAGARDVLCAGEERRGDLFGFIRDVHTVLLTESCGFETDFIKYLKF